MRPIRVCPEKEALHFIALEKDKDIFQKTFISKDKGYGVITTKNIVPGEFLLEYVGRHITGFEGEALYEEYSDVDAAFLYFYYFQGQTFCIDGSKDTARLGRFINHDHVKPNSKIKIILDEQKIPHLCAFAITEILAGEEIVYDYGDPNCPWQNKTTASSNNEHMEKKESRWKSSIENLESEPGMMEIDGLVFNPKMKIANGSNGAEVFPGLFCNCLVAVKRVAKHISENELKIANFLCSEKLKTKHLLQPLAVLEDNYFAYFVSPLCEYNLKDLIENKDFPKRQNLTEQWRLGICQELLLGLQELHSHRILHRDLKPENILFDINNKMYIGDFGASRKLDHTQITFLSQIAGTLSWASYEDVGGPKNKYKKESDIQVAGCLVHYILTDGQHPFQTTMPYFSDPFGLSLNVKMGNFTLQCEERWSSQKDIITRMLSRSLEERPTIEESLKAVMCLPHQSDFTGTMNNAGHDNQKNDGTHCCPETLDEMDIADSIVSNPPDKTSSNPLSSSSLTEEDFSDCEMTTGEQGLLSLEMSDEEVDDVPQSEEEETTEREAIYRKPPSQSEQNSHGSNSQQHMTVKMSSNTASQRVYDKKNYCLYCEKPYTKISRHLKQKHSDKPDVAKALAHKKGSTMHCLLLTKIRNMGNYHHNCYVLSSGKGQIIPKRQATCPSAVTDYLPCKFCFAMYVKTDLWRHHKRCRLQVKDNSTVKRRVQASSSLMLPMDTVISTGLKTVFQGMTYDSVTQLVKADSLILSLGERDADVQSERTPSRSQKETSLDEHCKESTASCKATGGIKKSSMPSSQKGKSKRPWSGTEREITEQYFKDFLKELKVPGKVDCQRCLNDNPILKDNGRDWKAVKYFVHNKITTLKRSLC